MSQPFIGEIRIISFNFAPQGWAFCNGQLLPINSNQALFAILGTTYGGNGQTNFALPNFKGRVPVHAGDWATLGQQGGEENHVVTLPEMPAHTHIGTVSERPATIADPSAALLAADGRGGRFSTTGQTPMAAQGVTAIGGSQPHYNMQPYLVLNFVIALIGIFPSQN